MSILQREFTQGDCFNSVTLYFIHFIWHFNEGFEKSSISNTNLKREFCDISVIFAKSAATGGIQALFRWKFPGFFSPFPGQIIRNRDFGIALDKFPPNLYNSDVEAI